MARLPYPGGSTSSEASRFWVTVQVGPRGGQFSPPLRALVDTSSRYTWIPRQVLEAVGATPERVWPFEHSDGRKESYAMGWVQIRLEAREEPTLVVFAPAGSEPVLGSVTLAGFGLAADPPNEALISVPGRL